MGGKALNIDCDTIMNLADVAKLIVSEQEASQLADEFNQILSSMKEAGIKAGDAEATEADKSDLCVQPCKQTLRKDEVKPFTNRKALFRNTRQESDGHIVVPRVLD